METREQETMGRDQVDAASLSELMRQLSEQSSRLARQEVELAKAELTEKGRSLGIGVGEFGAAGLVAVLALGALTATLILALSEVVDGWLAALIVTVAYLAVAGGLALAGRKKAKEATPPAPTATRRMRRQAERTRRMSETGRQDPGADRVRIGDRSQLADTVGAGGEDRRQGAGQGEGDRGEDERAGEEPRRPPRP